jgi:prepilin-type N-terminal cleavage/methylation domain-containing protein
MNRHFHRGYTLIELLLTLSLLGVFSLIATHLFGSSFQVMSQSAQVTEFPMRFDAAVNSLRSDIAEAISIDLPNPRSLIAKNSAGETIQWEIDGNHHLLRQDNSTSRSWDVGEAIEFRREGDLLLIHPSDSHDGTGDLAIEMRATK